MTSTPEATIVGFYEDVIIAGKTIRAKIDTGASMSSIDSVLASRLSLGPMISKSTVVNSHGKAVRPVFYVTLEIAGKKISAKFNTTSREHLRYPVLIGKNILRMGFVVDPKKRLKKKEKIIKNTRDVYGSPASAEE